MKESVFTEAYINEAGIQSGHQLAHLAQVHVAYGERKVSLFALKFHQVLVFQQGDGNLFGLYIYN